MNFFEKLEFLMKRDSIKNDKMLSEQSGIPYTTIKGFYSKGTENMKLSTIEKLCSCFNVTMDYLMRDDVTDTSYGLMQSAIEKFDSDKAELISFDDEEPRRLTSEETKNFYDKLLNLPKESFGDMALFMEFLEWKQNNKK